MIDFMFELGVGYIYIYCIGAQKHKFQMLSLFIPSNTSFGLALLLVPIELLSHVFKLLKTRVECTFFGNWFQVSQKMEEAKRTYRTFALLYIVCNLSF